jgi:hypothetical protein
MLGSTGVGTDVSPFCGGLTRGGGAETNATSAMVDGTYGMLPSLHSALIVHACMFPREHVPFVCADMTCLGVRAFLNTVYNPDLSPPATGCKAASLQYVVTPLSSLSLEHLLHAVRGVYLCQSHWDCCNPPRCLHVTKH